MQLRHGTMLDERDGHLVRVVDRDGVESATLAWRDGALDRLTAGALAVDGATFDHPLLGRCHRIGTTAMTALDWARPTEIPTVAAPGALPPSTGGIVLNVIALLAERAGIAALRYAGPYPTPALWRALARSFRTTATEAAFTTELLERAARVARDPIAIDFIPAHHERAAIPHGHVELRDGVERAVIDGIAYERDGSPARLGEPDDRGVGAEIWFGDRVYARVATLALDGRLVDGPHPVPPCTSDVVGREFPAELRAAIAELVAEAVPAPLAHDAAALVAAGPLRWADLGARAAADREGFALHAALWLHVAPHGLARLALAIAEALAPVVTARILRAVMSA